MGATAGRGGVRKEDGTVSRELREDWASRICWEVAAGGWYTQETVVLVAVVVGASPGRDCGGNVPKEGGSRVGPEEAAGAGGEGGDGGWEGRVRASGAGGNPVGTAVDGQADGAR